VSGLASPPPWTAHRRIKLITIFAANILVLGLVLLAFILYRDRNRRGTLGNKIKKKAQ
jgi:hypothetical protein